MKDIYFDDRYGKLFEEMENGEAGMFNFEHPLGSVQHLFIKRQIPIALNGEHYFDLVTPYGYGGPLIVEGSTDSRLELAAEFEKAFKDYCLSHKIVSEFIRFHPLAGNAADFEEAFEVMYMRETVCTNLKERDAPFDGEFSRSARKNIRQALKAGVEYKVTLNPASLDAFKEIYNATMERNHADSFYYFEDAYFKKVMELFGENLLLVEARFEGKVIGAGLNFVYGNLAHTHLSGTLSEYNHLSPASVIYHALAEWGKENGVDVIHAGGGRTNSPDDKLYLFKKQFGKESDCHFYIGKKIWNPLVYEALCEVSGTVDEVHFFPAYRAKQVKQTENV